MYKVGLLDLHIQRFVRYATTSLSSEKSSGESDVLFQMTYILRQVL